LVGFGPAARAAGPAAAGARHTAGTRRTLDASRTADATQTAGAGPFVGRVRDRAPKVISPVVRRLARDAGLDLAAVVAAGADGVIRRADVERLLAASATSATGGTGGPGGHATGGTGAHGTRTNGAAPAGDAVHAPTVRRVPLASRRAVVERMVRSRREIPEATAWRDVDVTDLLAARAQINAASPDHPVTVLGLLARVCVAGLARFPELNATIDGERAEILQYSSVDLGVAVAGARSLVVPVVRNAGELAAPGLSARIRELTARAGAGTLTPAELSGGTFTLNNHGALGSDGAVPIINHPQVAQLAVGRIAQRPWVVGGEIRPRHVAQLTVVFDHRACDGAPVGGFLSFLARCVEQPLLLIAEL
jgi:pyruvate dehydrogenase E2 component (dihydrolipoamide acetyltransferase)